MILQPISIIASFLFCVCGVCREGKVQAQKEKSYSQIDYRLRARARDTIVCPSHVVVPESGLVVTSRVNYTREVQSEGDKRFSHYAMRWCVKGESVCQVLGEDSLQLCCRDVSAWATVAAN
ncbi:hypothetical protein CEXT_13091 [Caerostris extrusa]|uniref:Uncharacterized protein n=1 Tax=Caerostris extrusa TaxID=172846 RepID=A0AAV4VAZ4_CAEEX|nr:hypothetical protein CEXT_13091 [Caerostris extrusa]